MSKNINSQETYKYRGFDSPNYTIVPDGLFDELLPILTGAELKVLLYIIRRTFGFKKDYDSISFNQICNGIKTKDGRPLDQGTGLSSSTAQAAVKGLIDKNIIIATRNRSQEKGDEPTTYRLNVLGPVVENRQRGGPEIDNGGWRKSTTQQTVLQETVRQDLVVVAGTLQTFGISQKVADQLAQAYPEDYLLQKLDLVQWLLDTKNPLVTTNPAGYLRKAIEEDYTPPKGYQSKAQREAEAQRRAQEDEQQREQREQLRRETEAAFQKAKEEAKEQLQEQAPARPIAGSRLTTESAWKRVLSKLQEQLSQATFETWLRDTRLMEVERERAVVAVPTRFAMEWLSKRHSSQLQAKLGEVLGYEVELRYEVVAEEPDREMELEGGRKNSALRAVGGPRTGRKGRNQQRDYPPP